MPEVAATVVVVGLGVYGAAGLLFAMAFVTRGATRIDARATNAGWGFRALILPGAVLFWPVLARRWSRARGNLR